MATRFLAPVEYRMEGRQDMIERVTPQEKPEREAECGSTADPTRNTRNTLESSRLSKDYWDIWTKVDPMFKSNFFGKFVPNSAAEVRQACKIYEKYCDFHYLQPSVDDQAIALKSTFKSKCLAIQRASTEEMRKIALLAARRELRGLEYMESLLKAEAEGCLVKAHVKEKA
jgi:hypothetical protein